MLIEHTFDVNAGVLQFQVCRIRMAGSILAASGEAFLFRSLMIFSLAADLCFTKRSENSERFIFQISARGFLLVP
jgi:hypothetical protein